MSIRKGEIYFVDLDPVKGREQSGIRPVLVVSSDKVNQLPLVAAVVVGTRGDNVPRDFKTNVRVSPGESGLPLETVFLCFQIRSLDARRFPDHPAGRLSTEAMSRVDETLRYCLDLEDGA